MEQSRGSGWHRPTTPGGRLLAWGRARLRRQGTGLRGPVKASQTQGPPVRTQTEVQWGQSSGVWGAAMQAAVQH